MYDVLLDTVIDVVKLIPFLFIAFLIIEFFEHKLSKKNKNIISNNSWGPLLGSLLGAIPQCGFSVMATNLYSIRIISLGTLISIYLSTSDEMIPILLSHRVSMVFIAEVLLIKILIGMSCGFLIDFVLRNKKVKVEDVKYDICDSEHCDCKNGILKSSLKHTVLITIFIFLISFVLNIIMEFVGSDILSKILLRNSVFGSFITSLIGLIPNCCSSVIVSELYIRGAISFGSMIGGLLTGSGVGLLVLFRVNKPIKENLKIIGLLYAIGVVSGIVIDLLSII